jgi:hypothetical protein
MERDWYHFEGWQCNMGVDRFVINRGGVIQGSCGAQNLFNLDKPLTIYDTDLTEKFNKDIVNPLICKQPYCGSPTEVKLPKQKIYDRTV